MSIFRARVAPPQFNGQVGADSSRREPGVAFFSLCRSSASDMSPRDARSKMH